MSLGILTGKPHDLKIDNTNYDTDLYYFPKNERINLEQKKEKTMDFNIPKSHQEISTVFNPVFNASNVLSELLLKHYINPEDKRNLLMKKIHNHLIELRYMLDEDLQKEVKDLSCSAVYHPLEM